MTRKDYETIARALKRAKNHLMDNTELTGKDMLNFTIGKIIDEIELDNKEFIRKRFIDLL